jgi:photosystem II stability/assembly factor-like uncharacterized protein
VFVVGVVWYARAGEAMVMQSMFTNDQTATAGTAWVRSDRGLYGGPVTAVAAVSPKSTVVYAGTREDEMYVSSNGGGLWTPLGGASTGCYVSGIAVDDMNSGRVIGKAVYGKGFFLSEDGGRTWKIAGRGLHSRSISCLASAQDAPAVMFAGTGDAGLYVSRDAGRSWKRTGGTMLGSRITCVNVSPDGLVVYAGTQETGLFGSRDGGETWAVVSLPFGSQPIVTDIDSDPADGQRIAVCVANGGACVSSDGGITWAASRDGSLPSDCAAIRFVRGTALVIGTQSGVFWYSPGGAADWRIAGRLPDGGHVFGLARGSARVLAATSHGVMSSLDGTEWRESSTGITNLTLAALAVSPADASRMFTATDDGVYRSLDAGRSWSRCSASVNVLSVLALDDGHTVLAGTADGAVLRSTDGGVRWNTITRGVPGMKVDLLAMRTGQPAAVYAGTDGGFAVSYDAGRTWETRNIGLVPAATAGSPAPRVEIAALLADTKDPGSILLSLLGRGLYTSSDDGQRWKSVEPGAGTPWIDSLAADASTGMLYAGTDADGVAVSRDGGATWSRSGKGLSTLLSTPGAINTLTVAADGTVYAGTASRGAARSDDGGVTWHRINSGLPDIDVRCIMTAGTEIFAMTEHCIVLLSSQ